MKLVKKILLVSLSLWSLGVVAEPAGWRCSAVDNQGNSWVHYGPTMNAATNWAISVCRDDSIRPHSCHYLKKSCYRTNPAATWRCYATDFRGDIRWTRMANGARWRAVRAAFNRCKDYSPRPGTCAVAPSTCTRVR